MRQKIVAIIISILLAFSIIWYLFFLNPLEIKIEKLATSATIVNHVMLEQKENENEKVIVVPLEENNETNEIKNINLEPGIYYIKVNYEAQVVTIYAKDEQGDYTKPVKAMICSTGAATPKSGVYSIPTRWRWGALQGNVYGQYVTKITGNILFHSVPYLKMYDPSSLEYWEYDKLGTNASLGCVRLTVEDAKWIYDNCLNGSKVEFYASPDSGPLEKPSAKKISNYPDNLKKWDPTDLDEENPWIKYFEKNFS